MAGARLCTAARSALWSPNLAQSSNEASEIITIWSLNQCEALSTYQQSATLLSQWHGKWHWRHHHPIIAVGWYGAVFWPYAYWDFVDYTFWPYAYDVFWPYAYDDLYVGVFGPYAYEGPAYAEPAPSSRRARRAHVHDLDEFQDAFCERLQSLAYSHDLLVKHDWQSVNIRDLAVGQLEAFGDPGNVKTEGEPIFINPAATEQLGLALYELGSNSMKYGALKQDGKVSVTWRVLEDSTLEFVWQETGAPPHKVGQNGFGHLVLTEIVPKTLRGRGILSDNADGITYRLSMHPQYYRTVGALDPELALNRHPAVTVSSLLSAAKQT